VKYAYIRGQVQVWPVSWMCRALGVSRGGYYGWLRCPESTRAREDAQLTAQLRAFHRESGGTCGSPRLHEQLGRCGIRCSRKRVVRLMHTAELKGVPKRRFVVTTESEAGAATAPNLLDRRFAPGEVAAWAADLTYIRTTEGFLYLAVVMSIQSRRILGHAIGAVRNSALCLSALKMALSNQRPAAGTLHHSDRGTTYTSREYQEVLEQSGLVASMSRSGNCYDNAVVESLIATLKRELLAGRKNMTRAEAKLVITKYVEYYNSTRLHSTLGYCSPMEYERIHLALN
jgi:putative transposase